MLWVPSHLDDHHVLRDYRSANSGATWVRRRGQFLRRLLLDDVSWLALVM